MSVCFFMCNAFRRWATEKRVFCSPLGLGFGPFNFPQFPTKVHHFRLHMGKWETKQSWGSNLSASRFIFFRKFIPDGPRLTKSMHLRGFPSSLRLLLAMLSRFRLLLVVIIKNPQILDEIWISKFQLPLFLGAISMFCNAKSVQGTPAAFGSADSRVAPQPPCVGVSEPNTPDTKKGGFFQFNSNLMGFNGI